MTQTVDTANPEDALVALTEDERMIRDAARDYAESIRPRARAHDQSGEFPWDQWKAGAEMGFGGMVIPEEHGGLGLSNMALTLVLEEINKADASVGVTFSVHNSLCSTAIRDFGTDEQKQKHLPRLASGEIIGSYSLSEPGCGSDAAALECKAEKVDGGWKVNGVKNWITSGVESELAVVFVRTGRGDKPHHGITCLIAEKSMDGFSVGTVEKKMGIRASSTTEYVFEDCFIPEENLLGEQDRGFRIAMALLDGGRIGIAAQANGIARACLEESVRYAREREQFGRPIADFQAIQFKLADMATRIEAARLLTYRAARARDAGRPHTTEASQAKLFASRTANHCAREAVQIHGGAGYTKDYEVERLYRDARITEIYEGTSQIQNLVIARNLLRD